jgi:3-methylcrotonyl-CoA carboxylase alpha subunit
MTVRISPIPSKPGHYDVTVRASSGSTTVYRSVAAQMNSSTSISTTIESVLAKTTIVSQKPPPGMPASQSPSTTERLHVFLNGKKTTLMLPPPSWLLSLAGDVLNAAAEKEKGGLKAPMPSLVVEVKVKVGDTVDKGQAIVVLESMKTETVLRAGGKGIVRAISCKNGEMVEEGRKLIDIEIEESA